MRPLVHLGVSFDRDPRGGEHLKAMGPTGFAWAVSTEHPVPIANDTEVLLFDPSAWLVRVPTSSPLPQGPEERVIYFGKGLFACHMAMIVRPPSNERIELSD